MSERSSAITLQLAGRFTRSKANLGEPTFIANIADIRVQEKLNRLYSQDADWNQLLRQSSEYAIQEQIDLYEFIDGFNNLPNEIPLQNIRPPKNVIIYHTECQDWTPENFFAGLQGVGTLEQLHHDINVERNTLIIVLARKVPLDWARIEGLYDLHWELYVLYWEQGKDLLYIAGSHSGGYCKSLAEAVAGFSFMLEPGFEDELNRESLTTGLRLAFEDQQILLSSGESLTVKAEDDQPLWWISDEGRNRSYRIEKKGDQLIVYGSVWPVRGQQVFRCFHGIRRMIIHNLGLTLPYNQLVRFIMRAGSNVGDALTQRDRKNTYELNMAGGGSDADERTSVGCSRRGKIWSQGGVNIIQLTEMGSEGRPQGDRSQHRSRGNPENVH